MTMAESTIDQIMRDVASLSSDQLQRLITLLTVRLTQESPRKTIEQVAAEQGKGPLNFGEIRELGSFFPESESVDDLVRTLQSLRQDRTARTLD